MGLYRRENNLPSQKAGNVDYSEINDLKQKSDNIGDAWTSRTYNVGEYAIYNNKMWKCLVSNNVAPSESANWTQVTIAEELGGVRLGFDADGNYGYYKVGADTLTPFKKANEIVTGGYSTSHDVKSTTITVTVGNIGANRENCVVAVTSINLRCNRGDFGNIALQNTYYEKATGNINVQVSSSSDTGAFQGCSWVAIYDE